VGFLLSCFDFQNLVLMKMNVLEHLSKLVAFDTQNPPRNITEDGLFLYLKESLGPKFTFEFWDHGNGCLSLLATRGQPKHLFNFHIDTVPAAEGYTGDPHTLRVQDGRAIGLGACDIKGASACMLAAASVTTGPVALLFTSDEEAGKSVCVREFCKLLKVCPTVIVAEPTMARAVLEHRGILTATAKFSGISGHASSGRADTDSALHHAIRWSHAVLESARGRRVSYKNLEGLCLNLGRLEGGVKPNMIASSAELSFGFRPLPDMDGFALLEEFKALGDASLELNPGFYGPPLPGPARRPAEALAAEIGLDVADPVNFWTEASLFSEAGYDALVFGPGDIAQAHTADEWVSVDQLDAVFTHYRRMLSL